MPQLQVKNLACERNNRPLFKDINFSLDKSQILYIQGANGAGKTTLLRSLVGLYPISSGEILWQEKNIESNRSEFNEEFLYLGHQSGIKGTLTVLENLKMQISWRGINAQNQHETIKNTLKRLGLTDIQNRLCQNLSAGQQRRLALARLLLSKVSLWILDEPLTAIDKDGVELIHQLIMEHINSRGMVILTSHQALRFDDINLLELII